MRASTAEPVRISPAALVLALAIACLLHAALTDCAAPPPPPSPPMTQGAIALANLDQQIEQQAGDPASLDLLLLRMQFTADYRMLDRAAALAGLNTSSGPEQLLRRARASAAAHRFSEALADLDAAARSGASAEQLKAQRAAILIATGRAAEAFPHLQAEAARRPGFATLCALARAHAALGRLGEADSLYVQALRMLDTTSPFPFAAVAFARGLMWSEQGGDSARGTALYQQALQAVPAYAAASIHLAELEIERGETASAQARLQQVVDTTNEPEALALLGGLHLRQGQSARGHAEIEQARQRYEALLTSHPEAFADHAAEFYLGAGQDPQRAWTWASVNLRERPTRRAHLLAIRAAQAMGLKERARTLQAQMQARHSDRAA